MQGEASSQGAVIDDSGVGAGAVHLQWNDRDWAFTSRNGYYYEYDLQEWWHRQAAGITHRVGPMLGPVQLGQ